MIHTDYRIRWWLTSMGYAIEGLSEVEIHTLFAREAAQWGLAPETLRQLIQESAEVPEAAAPGTLRHAA